MAEVESKKMVGLSSDEIFSDSTPVTAVTGDPNSLRRLALAEIDKAPTGFSHIRSVIVAGTGFFTDAYDLFSANFITTMIGFEFLQITCHSYSGKHSYQTIYHCWRDYWPGSLQVAC